VGRHLGVQHILLYDSGFDFSILTTQALYAAVMVMESNASMVSRLAGRHTVDSLWITFECRILNRKYETHIAWLFRYVNYDITSGANFPSRIDFKMGMVYLFGIKVAGSLIQNHF
jgi:hypothetical protein